MIKYKSLFIAVFFLLMGGGCLSLSPRPVLPTAIPVVAPTLPPSRPTVPATPTPAPTDMPPTETATNTPQPLSAQQPFSITLPVAQSTVEVNGLLYLSADYGRDAQRQWPLIVFLHGSGERGTDPRRLTSIGLPQYLQDRLDVPFVVVSPQLPPGDEWNDKGEMINALVDAIETQYAIDPQRVYLTGFSLGGFGTWALGLNSPDRFAALVPVAGGWEFGSDAVPANICDLAYKAHLGISRRAG